MAIERHPDDPGPAEVTPSLIAAVGRMFAGGPEIRGLLGQLLWIARNTPEGRSGRPADAVGVTAATWNRWLLHARYGEGRGPNKANRAAIRAVVRAGRGQGKRTGRRPRVRVTAVITWNGYRNPTEKRSTVLDLATGADDPLEDAREAWEAGDDLAAAELFLEACEAAYGVPIEFDDIDRLELND